MGFFRPGKSDLFVEIFKGCRVLVPVKVLIAKSEGPRGETRPQLFVSLKSLEGIDDSHGVHLRQNPGVVAVADEASDVGQGKEDGASHGEKLRKLGGKPILIEGVVRSRLNEKIREAKEGRNIDMPDIAEINRNSTRPFFIRSKERAIVLPGAHQRRRNSLAGQKGRGQIETAHFPCVGRVNIAGVAENDIPLGNAQAGKKGLVPFPGEETLSVGPGPKNDSANSVRHKFRSEERRVGKG